jgi:hypothetical protein
MSNKQQTSVNWLIEKVKSKEWQDMYIWHKEDVFNQAKEMEKQQIIDAYNQGEFNQGCNGSAEDYIKETYK